MNFDLFTRDKELMAKLGAIPATQLPRPNFSFPVYLRERNSIMIGTGSGMLVWKLIVDTAEIHGC